MDLSPQDIYRIKWLHTTHFPVIAALVLWFMPIAHQRATPLWNVSQVKGTITARALNESSGLAIAPQLPDILWSHNDSGDAPSLYAIARDGRLLGRVELRGIPAYDIEDIAAGPCTPGAARWCLFVADIGDNRHVRRYVRIYRFPLPNADAPTHAPLNVEHIDYVQYPNGAHDAEALAVHPHTGARWIVQKTKSGKSAVFVLPEGTSSATSPLVMTQAAVFHIHGASGVGRLVTAADFANDGRCLALRTYVAVHTYCADGSTTPRAYAQAKPDVLTTPTMLQSEALAYDPKTKGLWLSSERWPSPLLYISPRSTPR